MRGLDDVEIFALIYSAVLAPALFFFGCRRSDSDYYYQSEYEGHCEEVKVDKVFVAFSRDQVIIVQHRCYMRVLKQPHVVVVGAYTHDLFCRQREGTCST